MIRNSRDFFMTLHVNIATNTYEDALILLERSCPDLQSVDIEIEFGTDHSQSKILRDFVGRIFDAHGIFAPWKGRFILITDELVNNAIEHGSAAWDLDSAIIRAGKGSDGCFSISLEVHDTGRGPDSSKAKDMVTIKEAHTQDGDEVYMEKRGRGLFHITEKLVDTMSFDVSPRGGLAVKVEKRIG